MQVKNTILCFLLLMLQSLAAKNHPETLTMPKIVYLGELTCTLPAPSALNIDGVGSNWVELSWPLVSGADQYRLQAYDAVSGLEAGPTVFVPGNVNTAVVSTADASSGSCFVRIWSVCTGGEYDQNTYRESETFDSVIIELITHGYSLPDNPTGDCTLGVGISQGCSFDWDISETAFRVTYEYANTNYTRDFTLNISSSGDETSVQVNDETTGNTDQNLIFDIELDQQNNPVYLLVSFREKTDDPKGDLVARLAVGHDVNPSIGVFYIYDFIASGCQVERMIKGTGGDSERPGNMLEIPGKTANTPQINVKPNPFSEFINVALPNANVDTETTISLYNLLGALQQRLIVPANQHEAVLNTADLAPGVYMLKMESEGRVTTLKLVKTQ